MEAAPTEQIVQAARWLAAQDLDVISFSGGGHGGPHNGTALLDRLVEEIVAETGVLWVNAAGNEGAQHWVGSAADRDGDMVVELDGRFRGVAVRPSGGDIAMLVNWDDWGPNPMRPATTQDIDAFLFEVGGGRPPRVVAQSTTPQVGRNPPIEVVQHRVRQPGGQYVLIFRASHLTRPVRLHVYNLVPGSPMAPASATGSIGIPATAPAALAVGAVDVASGRLETFSSQGPTDDGRMKPEVSAPDRTPSLAYGHPFPGTSAACPHVSGFAALLKQVNPSADREALSELVMRHVRPLGGGAPNNEYGHGHIDAKEVDLEVPDTLELPNYLGGRTSVLAIDELWEGDRPESSPRLGLRVRVNERGRDGELPRYRIGDPMKVGFATDERCRYTLILRDAGGKYRVMASSELTPGEPQLVPEEEGVSWTISEPAGEEGFLLVCARSEVDVEDWVARGNAGGVVEVAVAKYRVVP